MYRLYGSNGTGSVSVEAALALLGLEYTVEKVDTSKDEHLSDSFGAINPRRQVPALMLPDGSIMTEGAAMMLHLADAIPEKHLAPAPGTATRAQHDRWLVFMAVNIYEGELRKAYAERYCETPEGVEGVRSSAHAYVKSQYALLEGVIGEGPYLQGSQPTMADLYLWMLSSWMEPGWLEINCPKVAALSSAVRKLPSVAPIHQAHFG